MIRATLVTLTLCLAVSFAAPARAGRLFSRVYEYRATTTLEVGVDVEPGLRLDSVRFLAPSAGDGTTARAGETVRAEVALSNTGSDSRRVGIALALFDERSRLLGVASGGDRLFPLKAGRQATYLLTFSYVNAEAPGATKFQISLETKP